MKLPTLPNLATLSRRERLLVAGSLLALSLVLLDRFVLGPWWRHTRRIRQEIQTLERTLATHHKLLSRKPAIVAQVEGYRDYLRSGTKGETEMAALLREIETLGQESGVSIGEVKPLAATSNGPYQEHAIKIQYEAGLHQSLRFIYLLEDSKLLFTVKQATLAVKEPGADILKGTLRLISMTIPAQPSPSPPTQEEPSDQAAL